MNQFRFSRRPDIGDKISVSFEFFPPKTDEMEARLWDTVHAAGAAEAEIRLGDLWRRRLDARAHRPAPSGASSTRPTLTPAAHLTCVDATRDEVDAVIREFADMGVKRFVALARRSGGRRRRALPAASGRLCQRRRTGRRR